MRLLVLALALLVYGNVTHAKSKKTDWFFNPSCDIRKLWDAVPKHKEIPEMVICHVWKMPNGQYVPRYDPTADRNYVETAEDLKSKAELEPITLEQLTKLQAQYK